MAENSQHYFDALSANPLLLTVQVKTTAASAEGMQHGIRYAALRLEQLTDCWPV